MSPIPAPSAAPDLAVILGEMRAAIASEGPRNGLAGKLQAVFLGILEMLAAMLADFRAGRLAAMAAVTAAPDSDRAQGVGGDAGPAAPLAASRRARGNRRAAGRGGNPGAASWGAQALCAGGPGLRRRVGDSPGLRGPVAGIPLMTPARFASAALRLSACCCRSERRFTPRGAADFIH